MAVRLTPEASMAIARVVASTAVVSRNAHGPSGAAMEKNTATKRSASTLPKRPSILVRSRSLSPPSLAERCRLSLTEKTDLGGTVRHPKERTIGSRERLMY